MPQHYYHRQPAPRQRPSSHTHRQPHTSAYMPPGANPRSLNEGQVQPMYPGVDPYYPPFQEVEASGLVPYSPGGPGGPGGNLFGGGAPVASPVPVEAPASSSGFSLANIGELKGMIDRFGGIDGIMSGIGKMQKVVGGFQQMAPMMKLVMGILPFGKGKKSSAADKDYEEYSPPRSRKRRKKTTAAPRKRNTTSKSGRNKSNSTKRRPKRSQKI